MEQFTASNEDYLLNSTQASRLLNCSRVYFYRLVKLGKILKADTGQRRNVQYKKQDILNFINGRKNNN